jgi:hypothetical protein
VKSAQSAIAPSSVQYVALDGDVTIISLEPATIADILDTICHCR